MGKELILVVIFKRVIGVWVFLKFQSYWWVFVQITPLNLDNFYQINIVDILDLIESPTAYHIFKNPFLLLYAK